MSQTQDKPERAATDSTPRWVKVFGIITLVLILLVGIMLLSGGEHGPNLHIPSGSDTPSTSMTESGAAADDTAPAEHSTQQP